MLLLQLDTIRGPHSTGVLMVNSNQHTSVHKCMGTPWNLYDSRKFEKAFNGTNNLLLGHNRWATKGAINLRNAHPFEFEKLVGAHNGTLVSQYGLDDYQDFDVDSENLYHHMNRHGVDDAISKANGAMALTWYDKEKETINLFRNSQRPLFYCFSEDRKSLFWASEEWMLTVALAKNGIKHKDIVELAEMHLFSVGLNFGSLYNVQPFDRISVRKLEGHRPAQVRVTQTNTSSNTNTQGSSSTNATSAGTGKVVNIDIREFTKYIREEVEFYVQGEGKTKYNQHYILGYLMDNDKIPVRVFVQQTSELNEEMLTSPHTFKAKVVSYVADDGGYLVIGLGSLVELTDSNKEVKDEPEQLIEVFNGDKVTKEEFLKITSKHGCAWCSDKPSVEEAPDLIWLDRKDFVCAACQEDPTVVHHLQQGAK